MAGWVELRAKSFYSFGEGASHVHELLAQAKQYGYPALALTDTNLCGALEFARLAKSLGVRPITGGELTLTDGSRLALLAETRAGYSNISRLFTIANASDRKKPKLDPSYLPQHSEGVVLLTGGRDGPLSRLAVDDRTGEAHGLLKQYLDWYGPNSVYVELQQNLLHGDTDRNRKLVRIAEEAGVRVVATNDVHYHDPDRSRLQHALVAAKLNTTIDQALPHLRPNHHLHLKSPAEMERLFKECPQAVSNTLRVAKRCSFDLSTDLGYALPDAAVPTGCTPQGYLEQLCREGAIRRYGGVSSEVESRLVEEFCLIKRLNLAGFLLLYREIALLAQRIMVERGVIGPEAPVEERPPGRGRGSSAALLVGYLIGISHVDPLKWNLTLERFISEDMATLPDIDLDFPRGLRDELIERVHRHFGPEHAVLSGAVTTYKVKGIIQDLGKSLGLSQERLSLLSKRLHSHHAADLRDEMTQLPAFRDKVDAPGWRDLLDLAPQLMGAPRGAEPARRRHGAQQLLHPGDGPSEGRSRGRPLHHGLGQRQRGRRRVRQDRHPLAAGARPDRGGPRPRGGAGGQAARPGPDQPGGPQRLRHDQCGPLQGGLPAPVPRAAEDGPAAEIAQPPRPRLSGRPHPSRRGRPGQRRLPVRRTLPARG